MVVFLLTPGIVPRFDFELARTKMLLVEKKEARECQRRHGPLPSQSIMYTSFGRGRKKRKKEGRESEGGTV